jgi:uncharacterized protein
MFRLGEFHAFSGGGRRFLYTVPSAGIFELDDASASVLALLAQKEAAREELMTVADEETIGELVLARIITTSQGFGLYQQDEPQPLPENFPLQTMVMNLTNQCNLSCQYCYEFGEDKVATPEGKPKFMDFETASASVDYLFTQSAGRHGLHITFFGGETLMNFPLLKKVVGYARQKAAEQGRSVDFSLTTNATLLTPAIIEYLSENEIGVTVSMDGDKAAHDKFRVFSNGKGSYDIIEPRVRALIKEHKTRPIVARVTMTSQAMDVLGTYRHLKNDLGFHEIGFAPVTTSPNRLYSIDNRGLDSVLDQFGVLAAEYLAHALRGEHHGFSNVSDTLSELHQGVNKSHPCGAGLGLVGVGPSGDIAPCHRFVDSDTHTLGHVSTGIDKAKQNDFLSRGHIQVKTDCRTCWARPVCAGGCHHEAYVRYGDTGHPNLHYCDWIRGWTNTCLEIYGAIAAENPDFLRHFSDRKAAA